MSRIDYGPMIDVFTGDYAINYGNNISALPNGRFVVVWNNHDTNPYTIMGVVYNANGSVGTGFTVNTSSGYVYDSPDVTSLANGQFVVAWIGETADSYSEVDAQIFNSNGTPTTVEFSTDELAGQWPSMTVLKNGNLVIVGTSATSNVGTVEVYNPNGTIVSGDTYTLPPYVDFPKVAALPSGGFVVDWMYYNAYQYHLYAKFFDASGLPTAQGPVLIGSGAQNFVNVAALINGKVVFTWCSGTGATGNNGGVNSSVNMRIMNSDGTPFTNKLVLGTLANATYVPTPAICALPDGQFIITWAPSNISSTQVSSSSVVGQLFDAFGGEIGKPFTISKPSESDQYANVTALTNGRVAVTWDAFNYDTGYNYINAQIVNLNPLGKDLAIAECEIATQVTNQKQLYNSGQSVFYLDDAALVASLANDIDPGGLNRDYILSSTGYTNTYGYIPPGYLNPQRLAQDFSNPDYDQCVALVLALDPTLPFDTNQWVEGSKQVAQFDFGVDFNQHA